MGPGRRPLRLRGGAALWIRIGKKLSLAIEQNDKKMAVSILESNRINLKLGWLKQTKDKAFFDIYNEYRKTKLGQLVLFKLAEYDAFGYRNYKGISNLDGKKERELDLETGLDAPPDIDTDVEIKLFTKKNITYTPPTKYFHTAKMFLRFSIRYGKVKLFGILLKMCRFGIKPRDILYISGFIDGIKGENGSITYHRKFRNIKNRMRYMEVVDVIFAGSWKKILKSAKKEKKKKVVEMMVREIEEIEIIEFIKEIE